MLQTIQIQKKELRRNGKVIKRLAHAIDETKLMASTTAGGVRGVIGIRADEVLTETPPRDVDDVSLEACDRDNDDARMTATAKTTNYHEATYPS